MAGAIPVGDHAGMEPNDVRRRFALALLGSAVLLVGAIALAETLF